MRRIIPVRIGHRTFHSRATAVKFFMDQRDAVIESGAVSEGEIFELLKALFLSWCECTGCGDPDGRVITSFSVDYEPRQNGSSWSQYRCYWVHFSSRQALPFSIK